MDFLSDVINYVRRIVKSPSNAVITDNLIIDYINRFYVNDLDARLQLFDLKTKYAFQTSPGVDKYNMPLYDVQIQPGAQTIAMLPVYQGFFSPAYINGVEVGFQTQKRSFFNIYPNIDQNLTVVATGNGSSGPYTFKIPILANFPFPPNPPLQGILRGHVDITGIMATGTNQDPPFGSTINTAIPTTSIESQVFITSLDVNGNNVIVQDSGQFLKVGGTKMPNFGLLMTPGNAPYGNTALANGYAPSFAITGIALGVTTVLTTTTSFVPGQRVTIENVIGTTELNGNTYTVLSNGGATLTIDVNSTLFTPYISGGTVSTIQNVVNYFTGEFISVYFPAAIPAGQDINVQCYYFQTGLPREIMYYNNVIYLRSPPDRQYLVELDAYLTPAAFLSTSAAVPFGYMSEYIARGAARKMLSDTGDIEQFQFYEPLFREQENLVWKRSQRVNTSTRTQTIYSQGMNQGQGFSGSNTLGGFNI